VAPPRPNGYGMSAVLDNTPIFILVYTNINSTKFPASSAGIVGEPRFMSQVGDSARSSVRVGLCVSAVRAVVMSVLVCLRSSYHVTGCWRLTFC
jgi:hypothetical protein